MTKKIILTVFLSFLFYPSFPQTKYLIYFKDKGITSDQFRLKSYLLQKDAENILSPKSIERRKKCLGEKLYITYDDLPINENYISALKVYGVRIIHKLKWFNAVSANLSKEQVTAIRELTFVEKIVLVKKLKSDIRNSEIKGNKFKNFSINLDSGYIYNYGPSFGQYMLSDIPPVHNLAITGEGIIIGMLDAGFKRTHEAFSNMNIIGEWDFVNNDSSTANEPWEDPYAEGHGTFTLSLVGGFSEGNMVAPSFSSSFVLAKTENVDIESHIEEDNFAAALEWMDSIGVDITSSSIGYSVFDDSTYSYTYEDMDGKTTIVSQACNLAFERGMINVTSAGNGGFTTWFYISAPADAFEIISVGAVTDQGVNTWWHSRGPTYDGRLKPEVCAQGEGYGISAEASGGFVISNGIWGTSGACPIAAGVVGMVLSEFSHLNNHQLRSIVLQSGDNLIHPDSVRGYGILSAVKAITFPNLAMVNGFFQLNKIFLNENGINPSSILLHYSMGNNPYNKEKLIFNGEYLYTFEFPLFFNPDTIKFYFTYNDTLGNSVRDPEESFYKFFYGDFIVELDLTNITSIENIHPINIEEFTLYQNYPNPFNPVTKIKFTIPAALSGDEVSEVTLKVYDIIGNEIAILVNEEKSWGVYEVEFNAADLPSGVYIYQIKAGNFIKTKKMILLK